jgi:hypothetical protein
MFTHLRFSVSESHRNTETRQRAGPYDPRQNAVISRYEPAQLDDDGTAGAGAIMVVRAGGQIRLSPYVGH